MSFKLITGTILIVLSISVLRAQQLTDSIITLEGIEVKEKAIRPLHPVTVVESSLMERSAVSDMGELLRSQPNVSGIRRGGYAIDPVVRGFRFSQVNIFLDEGIHIEGGCPNRMDPVLAHISMEDIEKIEIAHGPYLLRYGPTLGSSIKVLTHPGNPFVKKKLQAASFSSFDANRNGFRQYLSLNGSMEKAYYRATAGFTDFGNYTDGNGYEWETSFKKFGLSADAGLRINPLHQFELSYKGSFAHDIMFPALPMDETTDNTQIISGIYTHRNPVRTDDLIRISAYYSSVYHEMDNSRRPQYSAVVPPWQGIMQAMAKVDTRSIGARIITQRKYSMLMLEGGFDLNHTHKDGSRSVKMIMEMEGQQFINERTVTLWKDASALNSGLFAGFTGQSGKMSYSGTLRTDLNFSASGDTLLIEKDGRIYYDAHPSTLLFWSLGLNVGYQLSERLRISAGLGRGVRPPDLSERYIQFLATGFDRYDYLGNPELKPEINYQADLMLAFEAKQFHLFTNLFRSDIRQFITGMFLAPSVARPQSMGAPGVKQFHNIDRAVFYGFETGMQWEPFGGFIASFSAGYTYAVFPEIEKILFENGQALGTQIIRNDPLPEIPPLESALKFEYRIKQLRLSPALELRAVAAQNEVSGASYEDSSPGFFIAGLKLGWEPMRFINVNAGVSNLLNKAYYEHLNRRIIGSGNNFYEAGRTIWVNLKIAI